MSKLRYHDFKEVLLSEVKDHAVVNRILEKFQEIHNFDPLVSTFTESQAKHIEAWRIKTLEETGEAVWRYSKADCAAAVKATARPFASK